VKQLIFIGILIIAAGCAKMMLQPADYTWPMESVIKVNATGEISDDRYTFKINVKPIYYEEFADSNNVESKEIRVIRDKEGYYYFTGAGFKNIYMFYSVDGGMKLEEKINIPDTLSLQKPVFNQKSQSIELIDGLRKYLIIGPKIVRSK
jgi:hypothetical protein